MPSADLIYRFIGLDAGAGVQFDRMASKTLGLGRASTAAEKAISRLALGVGAVGVAVGVESIKAAANFQTAMTKIHTQADASNVTVGKLSKGILGMAAAVSTSPIALANAAFHIASVGQHSLTAAQQLRVLKIAAEGAKIGGADLVDTTNALDAAIVSHIKGVKDYSNAMGVLNATVGAGDMTMQDLADAMSTGVATAARTAGLSIQDVGAALAVFGDNNIRGETAAQRLIRVILLMQAPAKASAKALASIGIGQTQLAADLRKPDGLFMALTDLQTHLQQSGLDATQQAQVIAEAFGRSRGAANVELLLKEVGRLGNKFDIVSHQGANFFSSWTGYTKTFGASWDSFRSGFEALSIELGTKLLPTATHAMHWMATTGVKDLQDFGHWVEHNKTLLEDLGIALGGIAVSLKAVSIGRTIAGAFGGLRGGLGRSGSLGIGNAAPIPVFVTNWQGGVPGAGAGGTAGAGGSFGRLKGFGLSTLGTVAATASTVNIVTNQLKLPHGASIPDRALNAAGSAMLFGSTSGELHGSNKVLPSITPEQVTQLTSAQAHLKSLGIAGVQFVQTQKQAADAAKQNVQQLKALNQLLVVNPGLTAAASKAHDRLALSMQKVVGQAQIEAAMLGNDLGQGLIQGIEAQIPHVTQAGALLVSATVKEMRLAAMAHSPSELTTQLGVDLATGLSVGFHKASPQVRAQIRYDLQSLLGQMSTDITKSKTKLQDALLNEHQLIQQVLGSANLANVPTVASGYTGQTTRLTNIGAFLHGQARDYARFAKDLRRLSHLGLSKSLISQIAQMGPTQGLQFAEQIIAGGRGYARQLDIYDKRIQRSARAIGQDEYGHQIAADRRNLRRQTELLQEIRHDIHKMATTPGRGDVNITMDGRKFALTPQDAEEILRVLRRYERRLGKG